MAFNGTQWPRVHVWMGIGDLPADVCVRGSGVRGTHRRGGYSMVDINATDDVRSIDIQNRGRDSEFDTAGPCTATIVVDNSSGDYDWTNLAGPYVTGGVSRIDIGVPVVVQVQWPVGVYQTRFTGKLVDPELDVSGIPSLVTFTCADRLEDLGRAPLATEVAQFAGDLPGERINNVLDRAAVPATARAIDPGNVRLTATTFGASAAELLHRVEQTEFGFLFCDAGNNVVFYDRHRASTANRSVTVQASFTTTNNPGEISVVEVGRIARPRERVVNDAHITRLPDPAQDPEVTGIQPGDVPVEQVAIDQASIDKYGHLGLPTELGTLAASDADARSLAQGIVSVSATAQDRLRELTVNALGADAWATLLPLRLLDRIGVFCDYGPSTFVAELLIQKTGETIAVQPSPAWTMQFTTSNPPPATHYCIRGQGVRGTDLRGW